MRALGLSTSSVERGRKNVNHTTCMDSLYTTQSAYPRERRSSVEHESFMTRVMGRHAFSYSTPHLPPSTSTRENPPKPWKVPFLRRPRFKLFRSSATVPVPQSDPVSNSPESRASTPQQRAHRTDAYTIQETSYQTPPAPRLPQDFVQKCRKCSRVPPAFPPPRGPLPTPPTKWSYLEKCSVSRGPNAAHIRSVPALDDVWQHFIRSVVGDMPPGHLNSCDASATSRNSLTTRVVPGIVVSSEGETSDVASDTIKSASDPCPVSFKQHHLTSSPPSGSCYLGQRDSYASSQEHRTISCSSSEITLSMFPLPPDANSAPITDHAKARLGQDNLKAHSR